MMTEHVRVGGRPKMVHWQRDDGQKLKIFNILGPWQSAATIPTAALQSTNRSRRCLLGMQDWIVLDGFFPAVER